MNVAFSVIISVFAVFGCFCAFKLAVERFLTPKSFVPLAAIQLDGSEDDVTIDTLFTAARSSWVFSRCIAVIIPQGNSELALRVKRICKNNFMIVEK